MDIRTGDGNTDTIVRVFTLGTETHNRKDIHTGDGNRHNRKDIHTRDGNRHNRKGIHTGDGNTDTIVRLFTLGTEAQTIRTFTLRTETQTQS